MPRPDLPLGFVRLSEFVPSILLDIKYYSSDNFMGKPADGYQAPEAIISLPAAQALKKVQKSLEEIDLSLKIFDAYRPKRAVEHFLRWEKEVENPHLAQRFYPDFKKHELFERGYIASRSSHTRGSTLDLSLIAKTNQTWQELDMGSEFDFFGAASAYEYKEATATQRANRLLLRTLMERFGFKGFALEWWHFTLQNEPYPNQYFDFPVT
ncbi:M15 family metallopeptidase [Thiolinea disciformis]|uniref:M15 family metallopeptidase n=1 Tax=Thiolinea disciformis TaxID=125614 RepID=UPI000362EF79|nr:M15 family metallopeptidase [Thiolinea disciformis]